MCMFFVTRNLLESSLMQSHVTLYIYIKAEPSSIARILMSFKAEKEGQCMLSLFSFFYRLRDNETRINCNQTITTDSCLLTVLFFVVMIYKSNFSARFFLQIEIFSFLFTIYVC